MREGYKKTLAGEIPIEWEVKELGDLFNFSGGLSVPRSKLSDEGVYYLHYGDIHKRDKHDVNIYKDFEWIPKLDVDISSVKDESILNNGDIVFADASEDYEGIGKSVVIFNKDNKPFVSGLHTIVAKDTTNKMEHSYKKYCFSPDEVRKQFRVIATGSTVFGISKTNIKKVKILVPSQQEQKKIADILSAVDTQIDQTDKLIEKTKELKKGLMQKLLTRGIGHTEFKKTEVGEIPVDWEVKKLEQISNKIGDGLHGTPIYSDNGDYCFINGNNLTNGKIVFTNETKRVDKSEYCKYKKELTKSTLLISLNGTIGNLAYYNFQKIVLGKSTGYISLKDNVNKDYIFFALSNKKVQTYFLKELTGTTIKNLSLNALRKTPIAFPPVSEQKRIANILSSVDEKIQQYEARKEKLQELKKGLMQQLLTGKIRVI